MTPAPDSTVSPWGVIIFPGSNCDHDAVETIRRITGIPPREIWHREENLAGLKAVVVPGGFSYGDYLRSGAIARFAKAMDGLLSAANNGTLALGICNGFQILTEAGLLPGALLRNVGLRFICRDVYLHVERTDTPFTSRYQVGQVLRIPIAHNEGNYYLPPSELAELEANRQVVFRYCDRYGNIVPEANPNGSANNIAGIVNRAGTVLGMMPHPERRSDSLLGSPDGAPLFQSVNDHIAG